jgi:hypothetical protein
LVKCLLENFWSLMDLNPRPLTGVNGLVGVEILACPKVLLTLEILAIIGGYWALFEARSWGEVGRWLPTSDLYKPGLLEAMGGGSE